MSCKDVRQELGHNLEARTYIKMHGEEIAKKERQILDKFLIPRVALFI